MGITCVAIVGAAVGTPEPAHAWWARGGWGWRGGYGWAGYGRPYWPGPGYGWPAGYAWRGPGWWPAPSWGGYPPPPPGVWSAPPRLAALPTPYRYAPPPVRAPKHSVAYAAHTGSPARPPVAHPANPAAGSPPAAPLGAYYPPGD